MRVYFFALSLFIALFPVFLQSQTVGNYVEDESALYSSTKQVNQFFRRFNGEEDTKGDRYYPEDKDTATRPSGENISKISLIMIMLT